MSIRHCLSSTLTADRIRYVFLIAVAFVSMLGAASIPTGQAIAACGGGIIINQEGNPEFDPSLNCGPSANTGQPSFIDKWAAIVVSDTTTAFGYSWKANSQAEAEGLALRYCRQSAGDCHKAIWGHNVCVALARSGTIWGADSGDNRSIAESKAVAQCRTEGGQNCQVQANPCAQDP